MKKKKVFVTGSDGMLGNTICRELLNFGYAVKAMCLPGRDISVLDGLQIEIVYGTVLNKDFMLQEIKGCTFIIHVAALSNLWPRRNQILRDVNILGTKNVMEVAEELVISRMVHIGSASSFGHGTKDNPGDETTPFIGWKYGMDYIDSKYLAQQMLLERNAKTGFPVIIINPTLMIGPYNTGSASRQMLIDLFNGNMSFYSRGGKNFVCTIDVAQAAVNALTNGVIGHCYIIGNENLEYKEFFIKVHRTINKRFKMKAVHPVFVLAIGIIGSLVARITRNSPRLSYGMAVVGNMKHFFSSAKASRQLNIQQTPIEIGINQCLEWFKTKGCLK